MSFNSAEYALFLPIFFVLYWFVFNKNLRRQNLLIVFASYIFYGWWDWRFLTLIFFSSLTDFVIGKKLSRVADQGRRKALLWASILVNLGILGFFKYFNFFVDSFVEGMSSMGLQANARSLNIILPVGISFYTFQTLSYTIDIYRRKIEPVGDGVAFFAFVSFFPQLVAGPIERAKNLLPQFLGARTFEYEKGTDGMRQILWGLFKKIVIADTCARQVDAIFLNYDHLSGSVLLLGAIYFAFQIYGDFSGYSDIAIGTARLLGFDLMRNFAYPYFSRDIAEFWRRWHISLSTWFRDYVYIPLGGSYGSKSTRVRNILITFTTSGLWHGANWTFVAWGFLNGLYYLPGMLLDKKREKHTSIVAQNKPLPTPREFVQMLSTFSLTVFAWIFFRSETIGDAVIYIRRLFSTSLFEVPQTQLSILPLILMLVLVEWVQRDKQHVLQIGNLWASFRWPLYYGLIVSIIFFFSGKSAFIYFQF